MTKLCKYTAALGVAVSVMASAPFVSAEAQQRQNVPPVMRKAPPPPLPDQMQDVKAFFKENKRVNRPRFILFWNREFTDETVTYYVDYYARVYQSEYGHVRASERGRSYGGSASANVRATTNGSARVSQSGVKRLNQDEARKNLNEILNMKVESSFKNMFIKGGARLINRNMAIRTEGVDAGTNEQVNTHALETKAMMGKADYMVEIILTPSFESESGLAFQSNVVGIETGEVIASVYTDAMPPTIERVRFDATGSGFKQRTEREGFNDQAVGKQLAIDTMKELTSYWKMMASMEE